MRLEYLVDTNVLSEPKRPRPRASIVERLMSNLGSVATAAPVWHELLYGVERLPLSRRRSALETYLQDVVLASVPILPYDQAAAEWQAMSRSALSRQGITIPFLDGQIASIAATNDLILVTGNVRHFARLKGLKVEEWSDE